jgi:hypothetical protein
VASEIYIGCSNGELLRFALQADAFYALISHQTVVAGKPIDDMVIISSQHRALVQLDAQLHFYTVSSLDPIPQNIIRPIRHVVTFAVDHLHLASQSVDFCVVKWRAIVQYTLCDRLYYGKVSLDPQFTACLLNFTLGNTTPATEGDEETGLADGYSSLCMTFRTLDSWQATYKLALLHKSPVSIPHLIGMIQSGSFSNADRVWEMKTTGTVTPCHKPFTQNTCFAHV